MGDKLANNPEFKNLQKDNSHQRKILAKEIYKLVGACFSNIFNEAPFKKTRNYINLQLPANIMTILEKQADHDKCEFGILSLVDIGEIFMTMMQESGTIAYLKLQTKMESAEILNSELLLTTSRIKSISSMKSLLNDS